MGQRIRRLADGFHQAGVYELTWDGRDDGGRAVASGAYVYRLEAAERGWMTGRRLVLAR
jgi:flagellar hook assembly protein FlgD